MKTSLTRQFIATATQPPPTSPPLIRVAAMEKRTLPGIFRLLLPLLLLLALPAVVQAQFNYTTNNGTITITGYTGPGGDVTIPAMINDLPVTSIGDFAFSGLASLTNITIPDSVTNIGSYAFQLCTSLPSVTIPNGITSIGEGAFNNCTSLMAIRVDALNSVYGSVDGVLFDQRQTTLIQYPWGKSGSYAIPNGVTGIRDFAFQACTSLSSVTIPDSITNIGVGAFYNCFSLNSVTISNSATIIGDFAFNSCSSLTSIAIPNSVTSIGNLVFDSCGLTNITIPDSVTSIGYDAFYRCASLSRVTIGNSVSSLGDSAFAFCSSLTSITIPNSVTNIGDAAFSNCTSLSSIVVGALNAAYSSMDGVLFDKGRTTLIQCPGGKAGVYVIPNSVISIGDAAFSYCTALTSVTIPSSVASIGYNTFSFCASLTNVTIPNGVADLGYAAFNNCTSLGSITIPDSVTNIVNFAFGGCTSLTIIAIPNGVTSIGGQAFYGSTSLSRVTIGSGVASIEDAAFWACPNLTAIYFQGNSPSVGFSFLSDVNNGTVYCLPGSAGWGSTFGGVPTALWQPQVQTSDASFGVRTNQFGFNMTWASGMVVVVEASTNLSNSIWTSVATNTLTDGSSYFSDSGWTNYPACFYRLRSP